MPNMHRVDEMLCADEDGALEHFQSSAIELLHNNAFIFEMCGKILFRMMLDVAMEKNEVWSKALDVIESYVRTGPEDILILLDAIPRKFQSIYVSVQSLKCQNSL